MAENLSRDIADQLYSKVLGDMREQAKAEVQVEANARIEAMEARLKAMEAEKTLVMRDKDSLMGRINTLQDEVNVSRGTINKLEYEIQRLTNSYTEESKENNVISGTQKALIRDLENKVSTLQGQLSQASKRPTLTLPKPPSFDIKPIRDGAGNIISATVTPIGGH